MAPRIHVGPEPESLFTEAVEEGGAVVAADPAEAEAIVWLTGEPGGLVSVLHPGVRWVQLSSAGVEQWLADGVIDADRVWTSAAGAYGETVADHAVALALAGRRRPQGFARGDSSSRRPEGRPPFGCPVPRSGARAVCRAGDRPPGAAGGGAGGCAAAPWRAAARGRWAGGSSPCGRRGTAGSSG